MNLINIKNLYKSYGKQVVLKNVNLSLESGRIIGLLGPNGSGKTTLIKILNGLLKDYQGSISIDNQPIGVHSKSIISYLPDETYLENWMKVKDALSLFDDMYEDFDLELALSLLERMKLTKDMCIKDMSKGMKEKLQLILVMSRKALIYILDEPIAGVDPATRDFILDIIIKNYNEEAVVLLSTHLISDIENVFDEVIFLRDGEVVLHENTEKLREERNASIDKIFREEFRC